MDRRRFERGIGWSGDRARLGHGKPGSQRHDSSQPSNAPCPLDRHRQDQRTRTESGSVGVSRGPGFWWRHTMSGPAITMQQVIELPTVKVPSNEGDAPTQRSASPTRPLSKVGTTAVLLVVLDLAIASSHLFLASRLCALVLVVLLPGATIVGASRVRLESRVSQFALVIGAGLASLMAWALLASVLLPHFGVPRPLETLPLAVAINVIVIAAAFAGPNGHDPVLGTRPCAAVAIVDARIRRMRRPSLGRSRRRRTTQ